MKSSRWGSRGGMECVNNISQTTGSHRRTVPRESIETQPFIYGPAFCTEIAMHETSLE